MILLIDNYDSFTYNLYQYLRELGARVRVVRNDVLSVEAALRLRPAGIVLSPGPGRPESAGICVDLVRAAGRSLPLLGVCLGHQAIAAAYGGRVTRARRLMHGKVSSIRHDGRGVFRGIPDPMTATRYHSLAVESGSLPRELELSARAEDGTVMGLRLRRAPVEGVQFHPESLMTGQGKDLLRNFLRGTR